MKSHLLRAILLIITLLLLVGCDFSSGSSSSDADTTGQAPPTVTDPTPEDPTPENPGGGDTDTDDPATGGQSENDHNARFSLTLSSYAKTNDSQNTPANNSVSQSTVVQLAEGKILAVNQETGAEHIYNWALEVDEGSLEISSQVSLPLETGVYNFYFLMTSGEYQYAAINESWIIMDGQNLVSFLIHPVIGEQIPEIHVLQELAEFQFQYDENVVSEFDDPSFGIVIDSGDEHRFSINPETGLSSTFVYLPAGTYEFELNFYDGSLLKSVLLDGQTTITITEEGGTVHLEIVPLVFENTYTFDASDNTAEFVLVIPDNVIDEAGGVVNVEAKFSLTGGANNPVESVVSLTDNDAFFEGSVTVQNFVPGPVVWAIQIADISNGGSSVYAYCGQAVDLSVDSQTLTCDFNMLTASTIEENPPGELIVRVATYGFPISGAAIFVDDWFVGLTASENGANHGQLTVLIPAGNYTIAAKSSDGSLIVTTSAGVTESGSLVLDLELPPPPNNKPQASDAVAETLQETPVDITLSGSDPDPWDSLIWVGDTSPAKGTVSYIGNIVTYTPDAGFSGTDSFTFVVSDGSMDSDPATVTVQVTADPTPDINHAPVAVDLSVEMDQDTIATIVLDVTDEDGDPLIYRIDSNPANGIVSRSGDTVTYTPAVGYHGSDSFTYSAFDGTADSNTATVSITINEVVTTPVNNPPTAEDIYVTLDQDQVVVFNLLGKDVDADELFYSIETQPLHGTVTVSGDAATLTPESGYYGQDSFTYSVSDGLASSQPATVGLTILEVISPPVNVAPEVESLDVSTDQDVAIEFDLIGYDVDGDDLEFSISAYPQFGTVTIDNINGTAIYTPDSGYYGTDGFSYTASDGRLTSDPGDVSIVVNEKDGGQVNTPPSAEDLDAVTNQDTAVTITLVGSDPDEGNTLSYSVAVEPSNGTVDISGDQAIYTPDPGYIGDDSFYYQVSDGTDVSELAEVKITVSETVPPSVDEYVLTTSLTSWPWKRIKDEVKLDSPVDVVIPDHDSLEVLEGNPDWFMLILRFDRTRCIYSAAWDNLSGWFRWYGRKHRLSSPVCFGGAYQAGDEITVRKRIKAYLLTADPREDKTTVQVTIETAK